jgi:hypothetical protein
MKTIILNLFLALVLQAEAKVEIQDTQNLLGQLTQKLGSRELPELFKVGQKAIYDQFVDACEINCYEGDNQDDPVSIGSCTAACKEFTQDHIYEVISVDSEMAVITSNLGDYSERTAVEIRQCQGNLLLPLLENLDIRFNLSGRFVTEKISSFNLKISDQGSTKTILAHSIWGRFYIEGFKTGFPVKVSVSADVPGSAQIVMFSVLDKVWFKLKGI